MFCALVAFERMTQELCTPRCLFCVQCAQTLKHLSLVDNPTTRRPNYRLYTIHKIPSLKVFPCLWVHIHMRTRTIFVHKNIKYNMFAFMCICTHCDETHTHTHMSFRSFIPLASGNRPISVDWCNCFAGPWLPENKAKGESSDIASWSLCCDYFFCILRHDVDVSHDGDALWHAMLDRASVMTRTLRCVFHILNIFV